MVYDITSQESFERLENWRNHFINRSQYDSPKPPPFLVLGNKLDLADEGLRRVSLHQGLDYCKQHGDMIFYETSAKNSINVEHAFTQLAGEAMRR